MHSSRMRTVRCSGRRWGEGGICPEGVSAQGVSPRGQNDRHVQLRCGRKLQVCSYNGNGLLVVNVVHNVIHKVISCSFKGFNNSFQVITNNKGHNKGIMNNIVKDNISNDKQLCSQTRRLVYLLYCHDWFY